MSQNFDFFFSLQNIGILKLGYTLAINKNKLNFIKITRDQIAKMFLSMLCQKILILKIHRRPK